MPQSIDNNKPVKSPQDANASGTAAPQQTSSKPILETSDEERAKALTPLVEKVAASNQSLEDVKAEIELIIIRSLQIKPPLTPEKAEQFFKLNERLNALLELVQEAAKSDGKD